VKLVLDLIGERESGKPEKSLGYKGSVLTEHWTRRI